MSQMMFSCGLAYLNCMDAIRSHCLHKQCQINEREVAASWKEYICSHARCCSLLSAGRISVGKGTWDTSGHHWVTQKLMKEKKSVLACLLIFTTLHLLPVHEQMCWPGNIPLLVKMCLSMRDSEPLPNNLFGVGCGPLPILQVQWNSVWRTHRCCPLTTPHVVSSVLLYLNIRIQESRLNWFWHQRNIVFLPEKTILMSRSATMGNLIFESDTCAIPAADGITGLKYERDAGYCSTLHRSTPCVI